MRLSLLVVSVSLWAAPVLAQAPGDEPAPPPPAEPAPPPPPPAAPVVAPVVAPAPPPVEAVTNIVDRGTLEDANAGRVAIMPTALTPPKGTFSFEDWELFFISASYAPADNLVITGTTMVPITSDAYWGFLSAKLQVVKQGRLRVAVQAGAAGATVKSTDTTFDAMGNEMTSTSTSSGGGFDLGAAATYCLDDDCFSHINGAVIAGFAEEDNSSVPVGFMGGAVFRIGHKVRLIFEADTAHLFGKISDQANGFLGWYGLRFTSSQIGVDLALVKPFCGNGDCDTDSFPMGFPFVTFSYRAL